MRDPKALSFSRRVVKIAIHEGSRQFSPGKLEPNRIEALEQISFISDSGILNTHDGFSHVGPVGFRNRFLEITCKPKKHLIRRRRSKRESLFHRKEELRSSGQLGFLRRTFPAPVACETLAVRRIAIKCGSLGPLRLDSRLFGLLRLKWSSALSAILSTCQKRERL